MSGRDLGASVRQRLLNQARTHPICFHTVRFRTFGFQTCKRRVPESAG